jgi:hypothetical protein
MAFPNMMFGPDQEFFNMYGTGLAVDRHGLYCGQILQDSGGRQFRWVRNGGVALTAGDLLVGPAPIAAHVALTPAVAGVVGDTIISLTFATTSITADQYRDGWVMMRLGTGMGYAYAIDTHAAVASSVGTFVAPLKKGISVQVAIPTTASSASLVASPYNGVIQAPVTTLGTAIVGVAVKPLAINAWGWIQTKGPAMVTTAGTLVIGNPASYSATAGAVGPLSATFAADMTTQRIGTVLNVSTTTNKSLIMLDTIA